MIDLSPPRTSRDWALKGAWDASGTAAMMIVATMLGVGGLGREVGYPIWAVDLTTLLIWAGPAQVILFGGIAASASLPTVALAIMMSSMRFLPMTMSILPLLRAGGTRPWQIALGAHLVSMTTWVEGLRRLPPLEPSTRMAYYYGFSFVIIGSGTLATHAGFYLYEAVPVALAAGLLFMSPLFFSASLVRNARQMADWVALGLAAVISPVAFTLLPSGLDFLAVGVLAGTAGFLVRRRAVRKEAQP